MKIPTIGTNTIAPPSPPAASSIFRASRFIRNPVASVIHQLSLALRQIELAQSPQRRGVAEDSSTFSHKTFKSMSIRWLEIDPKPIQPFHPSRLRAFKDIMQSLVFLARFPGDLCRL